MPHVALWVRCTLVIVVSIIVTASGAFILKEDYPATAPTHVGEPCVFTCPHQSMVCRLGQCDFCITDTDCSSEREEAICEDKLCRHKRLWPLNSLDIISMSLSVVTVAVASGGGIGGGGILVAIFILVSHFSAHEAIPLSKAAIVGSAIYNLIYFFPLKHPLANRPRIDFDIAVILEPMTLAGTTLGVIFNHIFPEWIILMFLIIILGGTAYRTAIKGLEIWKAESEDGESTPLLSSTNTVPSHGGALSEHEEKELNEILKAEANPKPWLKIGVLVALWLIMFMIELARGGRGTGILPCGSAGYWFLFFMVFPIAFAITYTMGRHLLIIHKRKVALRYPFQPGDPLWDRRNTQLYPALCMMAGVVAGMLGVSGGMIKGPLLLEWGILPQVQSATTAFMVLFTSSCTTMQFLILGDLDTRYALLFICVGFFATVIGQNGIGYLIQKYKKTSLIVFSLTIILSASVLMIGFVGLRGMIHRANAHQEDSFRTLC